LAADDDLLDFAPDVEIPFTIEPQAMELVAQDLPEPQRRAYAERRLKAMEDKLYADSMEILDGVLGFADVDPEDPDPPKEWVASLGTELAQRRNRLARYGLLSNKDCPVGIRAAIQVMAATHKAKESRGTVNQVNVQVVQMPAPRSYDLPVKVVEE
jgi:hypothetical protein